MIMQGTWNGIDKIYCISIAERTDRQAEARAQFSKVGLADKVEFVVVEKDPIDCERGIYQSHMLCMRKGIAAEAERILIFEDDILFDRVTPKILANCMDFLTMHDQWHMVFLGCMVLGSQSTAFPSILRIQYRSLTQGYVIHRKFAETLVMYQWKGVSYDEFLKRLKDDQTYALYPAIAFQSNSRSDNERYMHLERFRRMVGGLLKIQKRNEFYHHHKRLIIGAHMLVLLFLIVVVMS